MKRYCAWHKKFFPDECDSRGDKYLGEKEPLANPVRTDGICPKCFGILVNEINGIKIQKITTEDPAAIKSLSNEGIQASSADMLQVV